MKKNSRKNIKGLYIALNKQDNNICASHTKTEIAQFLGIHPITLTRHLKDCSIYNNELYCVWKDVRVSKVRRGFAL